MSSIAALNHPRRCVRELGDFDAAMGWAFQDLVRADDSAFDDEIEAVHRNQKRREHTHTAMNQPFDLPHGFIAPTAARPSHSTSASHHKNGKKIVASHVHSAAYRKQPTSGKRSESRAVDHSAPVRCSRSPPKKKNDAEEEEIDFVYDTSVRRKLRERMDTDRWDTLHCVAERERQLRDENKWIGDGTSQRKHAWHADGTGAAHQSPPRANPTTDKKRATSAGSTRSSASASSRTKKAAVVSGKTSIAPNISEWRTQSFPFHPCEETERKQQLAEAQRRQQEQTRLSREVERTIDEFEQRMDQ